MFVSCRSFFDFVKLENLLLVCHFLGQTVRILGTIYLVRHFHRGNVSGEVYLHISSLLGISDCMTERDHASG